MEVVGVSLDFENVGGCVWMMTHQGDRGQMCYVRLYQSGPEQNLVLQQKLLFNRNRQKTCQPCDH